MAEDLTERKVFMDVLQYEGQLSDTRDKTQESFPGRINMKSRVARSIIAATCAVMLLGACGKSAMNQSSGSAAEAAYDEGGYGAYYDEDVYDAEATADYAYENAKEEAVGSTSNDVTQTDTEAGTDDSGKLTEQKLIYTADVQIQSLTFSETLASVKDAITKVGGFVESETTSDSARNWYYSDYTKSSGTLSSYITVRIPSNKYREFLTLLDGTGGKITSKSEYVQNITKRYNDQSILIKSLETQETRLLDMMEKAETIEDMITIEARLSEVQTQLNQARNVLASYDTDVAYSTVNLSISEVVRYDHPIVEQSFLERLANTFTRSWSDFSEFLQDLVLAIVYLLPVILIAVIILIILRPFFKKMGEKRKIKKAEKMAKKAVMPEYDIAKKYSNPFARKPKSPAAENKTTATETAVPASPADDTVRPDDASPAASAPKDEQQ